MCSKRIPFFFSSTESTTLKIRYSEIFEIIQKYSKIHKNFENLKFLKIFKTKELELGLGGVIFGFCEKNCAYFMH